MRKLEKLNEPEILSANKETWLAEYIADLGNSTKRYRYRDPEIKSRLKQETGFKCVYCESSIGHNTPGDIEHKVPSSKNRNLHFTWENLTVACTECNRRKNDYYVEGNEFLDPYVDQVEDLLEHHGPLVLWANGSTRGEITIRTLELNTASRSELVIKKIAAINDFVNLIERYVSESNFILKGLLLKSIEEKVDVHSEYSGMLKAILNAKGILI